MWLYWIRPLTSGFTATEDGLLLCWDKIRFHQAGLSLLAEPVHPHKGKVGSLQIWWGLSCWLCGDMAGMHRESWCIWCISDQHRNSRYCASTARLQWYKHEPRQAFHGCDIVRCCALRNNKSARVYSWNRHLWSEALWPCATSCINNGELDKGWFSVLSLCYKTAVPDRNRIIWTVSLEMEWLDFLCDITVSWRSRPIFVSC